MSHDPNHNPWTTLSTRQIYANAWIRIREDQVLKPNGSPGIYGVVEYCHRAVGVIPIDDEDHTWLVGQYRYTHNCYEWEIPEGGCRDDETLEEGVRRELLEETGLVAAHLEPLLLNLQLSNSVSNEVAHLFVARGLTQAAPQPDDTELLVIRRLPLAEAVKMARNGQIRDAMSVMALLAVGCPRDEGGKNLPESSMLI